MKTTVIVPCRNEESNIRLCLESLVKQHYPEEMEIVVIDNDSTDKTWDIVHDFSKSHKQIRLIGEPNPGTAAARNSGIRAAKHEYLAFIDADCEAPPGWLSLLSQKYRSAKDETPSLIAVGGRNIAPESASPFVKAVEIALDSWLGSLSSIQGRQLENPGFVPSLSLTNALYEKKPVLQVGGFDESLGCEAEDAEINYRFRTSGHKLLYIPESFVWHKMRSTPKSWFKNMFRYGKGRARLLKRYPRMWKPSYLAPPLLLLILISTVFSPLSKFFLLPLMYFPAIFLFSFFQVLRKNSPKALFHVFCVYIITHTGYALGQVYGLIHPEVR